MGLDHGDDFVSHHLIWVVIMAVLYQVSEVSDEGVERLICLLPLLQEVSGEDSVLLGCCVVTESA